MPKLPSLSELTDVSGLMNKFKSAIDNLTGPGTSTATEEALSKENDPIKAKFLEAELLINQLHDLNIIQNKTLADLKSKYAEVKKIAHEHLPETEKVEDPKASEAKAEEKPVEQQKNVAPKEEAKEQEKPAGDE